MRRRYGRRRPRKYGRGRRMRKRYSRRRPGAVKSLARKVRSLEKASLQTKIVVHDFDVSPGTILGGVSSTVVNLCDLTDYNLIYPSGTTAKFSFIGSTGSEQNILWRKVAVKGYIDTSTEHTNDVCTNVAFVVPRGRNRDVVPGSTGQEIRLHRDGRIYMDPTNWKILKQFSLVNITAPNNVMSTNDTPYYVGTYPLRKPFYFSKRWIGASGSTEINANGVPTSHNKNIYMITTTNNALADAHNPHVYGTKYFRYEDGVM